MTVVSINKWFFFSITIIIFGIHVVRKKAYLGSSTTGGWRGIPIHPPSFPCNILRHDNSDLTGVRWAIANQYYPRGVGIDVGQVIKFDHASPRIGYELDRTGMLWKGRWGIEEDKEKGYGKLELSLRVSEQVSTAKGTNWQISNKTDNRPRSGVNSWIRLNRQCPFYPTRLHKQHYHLCCAIKTQFCFGCSAIKQCQEQTHHFFNVFITCPISRRLEKQFMFCTNPSITWFSAN